MNEAITPLKKEPVELFNYVTKYIVRHRSDESLSEAWRFPLVSTTLHGDDLINAKTNEVTFVYYATQPVQNVNLVGSFLPLHKTIALENVRYHEEETPLYYVTLNLPINQGFRYKFIIDGKDTLDPVNPQRITLPTGKIWSFFFTDYYNQSAEFEEWEMSLMQRLVAQIMLFRTEDSQNFLDRFYQGLSRQDKQVIPIYRLDDSVGEVNYITNVLAREERHHLIDYKICIRLIDQVLRKRNPFVESWKVSDELINDLYIEMGNGQVDGWDYSQYNNPVYFLKLFRRHCIVGAFSHPRHGGNIGCSAWDYLRNKFCTRDEAGKMSGTYFNWPLAMEKPWGVNVEYRG